MLSFDQENNKEHNINKSINENINNMSQISKQIIKVKQKSLNNTNCTVVCSDDTSFEISMDLVLKYKISSNIIFSISQWNLILSEQNLINCKKIAYNFAIRKNYTEKQIIQKLSSQNFSEEEIEVSINFLIAYNLINDLEFSKKYIHDTLLKKRVGFLKLEQDLLSKGVPIETIKKAISEVYPFENIDNLIKKEIEKKMRQITHKPKNKHKQLLINYLINKGFNWEYIKKNINEYLDEYKFD